MATLKILMASLFASGTTITGAIVLDQFGYMNWRKTFKEDIQNWLSQDSRTSWKVQIKKDSNPVNLNDFNDDQYLSGLETYLGENKDKLTSLASGADKTLIFEKTGSNWKLSLTEQQITNWIGTISGTKATLKLAEENTPKELANLTQELNGIFDGLFKNKDVFEAIKTENPSSNKNTLFEKIGNDWKNSKKAIDELITANEWNKTKIKICSTGNNSTDLDSTDDNDLIGFYSHLKTYQADESSLRSTEASAADVTFKKETGGWEKKACQ